MSFYLIRILIPALIVDIPLTALLLRFAPSRKFLRWIAPFFSVLAYFISAVGCMHYYGRTGTFQGQGALGLLVFFVFGIICSFLRLGLAILISDRLNQRVKKSEI